MASENSNDGIPISMQDFQHSLGVPQERALLCRANEQRDVGENQHLPPLRGRHLQRAFQPSHLRRRNCAVVGNEAVLFLWQAGEPVCSLPEHLRVVLPHQLLGRFEPVVLRMDQGALIAVKDHGVPPVVEPFDPVHLALFAKALQTGALQRGAGEVVQVMVAYDVVARPGPASVENIKDGIQGAVCLLGLAIVTIDDIAQLDDLVHPGFVPMLHRPHRDFERMPEVPVLAAGKVGAVIPVGILDVRDETEFEWPGRLRAWLGLLRVACPSPRAKSAAKRHGAAEARPRGCPARSRSGRDSGRRASRRRPRR
mmetsp:Transcript_112484/g.323343  ORF Transcript_112484/g.323343 Transcript_112484/m.323343 type:complete len:311 (-) Transcript_112484:23-955(-)